MTTPPDALGTATRLGRMMLADAAPAREAARGVESVAGRAGLCQVHPDVTYSLLLTTARQDDGTAALQVEHVGPRSFNYGRLTETTRALDDHLHGRLDLAGLSARLDAVDRAAPRYPVWATRLAAGVAGITTATIFGAGPVAAAAAFAANMLIDWLFATLARRGWTTFFLQVLTGLVAIAAACGVHLVAPGVDTSQVVVAVIILMLCGMTSTGAVQDLLTGAYLAGVGRLAEAVVNTLGLVLGIQLGLFAARAAGIGLTVSPDIAFIGEPRWLMVAVSAVVALAFSTYAQMPARTLPVMALMTVFGWIVYSALLDAGAGPVAAAGAAATAGGVASVLLSRPIRVPAAVLASLALIPLFPGIVLYRGLLAGLSDGSEGSALVATALWTAGALAAGVMLGQQLAAGLAGQLSAAWRTSFQPHFDRIVRR